MTPPAVVLLYHAIEAGPPPLCMEPSLFARHLETIDESGARVVTLDRLVAALAAAGSRAAPIVAITFDDGAASVVERAAPLLAERRMPATVFCVAARLGGVGDWPSARRPIPSIRLAEGADLAELAASGFEIGSHGMTHAPLGAASGRELQREVVDSRSALERAVGVPVRWFAYPYGSVPEGHGRALVERTYTGAAALGNRTAAGYVDAWAIPRIDAHYVRRPPLLARLLRGDDRYLALRRSGARLRRLVRTDHL